MKEGWEIRKLGNVCTIGDGNYSSKYPKASEFTSKGIPFLTATNLKNGVIIPDELRYISEEQHLTLTKGHVKKNDLVIVVRGSSTGNNSIVSEDYEGSNLNSQLAFLRANSNNLDSRYLFRVFNSPDVQRVVTNTISGAAQPQLPNNKLLSIEIPIPPLSEQKRIVEILDEIFSTIAKAKANIEKNLLNTKELFENLSETLFTNKHNDWCDKSLSEIASFKNGLNFTKSSKGEIIKIVGVKDFQKNFWVPFNDLDSVIIDGKLDEIYFLRKDDIITVRSNGNPELIGRTLLAGSVTAKVSHSGFTIRIRLNSKDVFPAYLCHYLKSKKARKELVERGTGVNIKSLNQTALSSLTISIPKFYDDQQSIVEKLETFSSNAKKLQAVYNQKLNDLEELKKCILQKAFNGELTTATKNLVA